MSGFGPNADWLRNIQTNGDEEISIGSQQFSASHRILGEDEAIHALKGYESRNRLLAPVVPACIECTGRLEVHGFNRRSATLVLQLPLVAFHPKTKPSSDNP